MISMPMNGLSEDEVFDKFNEVSALLKSKGYLVVNTLLHDTDDLALEKQGVVQLPVWYLAESLKRMSECDTVYFCKGWRGARGCKIEHEVAKQYGLTMLYE